MLRLFGGDVVCYPNVMFSTVFAPARHECFIFLMNFNDSCLNPISLMLHRCSGAMNSMVLRTLRLCVARNFDDFRYILTIMFFAHVR